MGLFDKIGARRDPSGSAAKPAPYDFVEVPMPDGTVRHMSRSQFTAQPLEERIRVLVQGTARFMRAGQVLSAAEALKSDD
jgi:hypothetical protein